MGGKNTKRRRKHQAKLAKKLAQSAEAAASEATEAALTEAHFVHKQATPTSPSTRASHFLDMMNARLKRLQKPLGVLLLGNVAVGTYLLLTRKERPAHPSDEGSANASSQTAAGVSDQGQEPVHTHEAHEGPSGTSLVGSGGATLSTPGGTPIPMPSFAVPDHHQRHEDGHEGGSHPPHHERNQHGGPSGTSFVGSGGATLSTPGGTPIPLYSQSMADHHLRRGEKGEKEGATVSEAQRRRAREAREREIELDQNGDPVTRGPPDELQDEMKDTNGQGARGNHVGHVISGRSDKLTTDLALEQYRQGLLQELEKRRKMVPLSKEEKVWIDEEKEMIKEHLRHMPKSS